MILGIAGLFIGVIDYLVIFPAREKKQIVLSGLSGIILFSQLNSLCEIIITQLLLCAALIDLRKYILPDYLTLSLLLFGVIASTFQLIENSLLQAAWNMAFAGLLPGLPALIYKKLTGRHGLGYGDIKLLMAIAVWINFIYLPIIVIIACCSGLLAFILPLIKKNKIAFGPHLAFAGWLAITNNPTIIYITNLMIN